jgi:hypothetical protein
MDSRFRRNDGEGMDPGLRRDDEREGFRRNDGERMDSRFRGNDERGIELRLPPKRRRGYETHKNKAAGHRCPAAQNNKNLFSRLLLRLRRLLDRRRHRLHMGSRRGRDDVAAVVAVLEAAAEDHERIDVAGIVAAGTGRHGDFVVDLA